MTSKFYPYGSLCIDCNWHQWFQGLKKSLHSSEQRSELSSKISLLFSPSDNVIVTICVRTAFDLFLTTLNFPCGSEVLISSINIPEMARIIRRHGLIPVPVDIDINTMTTPADRVESSITPRTKLIVIAMLYGVIFDISEISKIAKKNNLILFEDCSECYSGKKFKGSDCADATVFSFGPIKTATAFGGGVIIIRNNDLLSKMKAIHSSYLIQPKSVYLKKVLKYSFGMLMVNSTRANYLTRLIGSTFNTDVQKHFIKLMRGFPASTGLEIYRFQPCAGLLSFLY